MNFARIEAHYHDCAALLYEGAQLIDTVISTAFVTATLFRSLNILINQIDNLSADDYLRIAKHSAEWITDTGETKWPLNDGFVDPPTKTTLKPGTLIDRYGEPSGKFAAPAGTPYTMRSLEPGSQFKPLHVYEIVEPVETLYGVTVPWFDELGGGIQYKFAQSIQDLIDAGIIREVIN